MKSTTTRALRLACIIVVMLMIPAGLLAQDEESAPEQASTFSKEELTQMLAPIALYPDSLTAQILMASTYPLEVVEAERWRRQNMGLKGEELDKALQEKSWDPSVKSLCHFPEVLFAMSEKLDQTRKLGDAFLSQEDDVTATIQELRRKADEQGNLKTTAEQKVTHEKEIIRIEPADPTVVYVPVYNPLYVYGPWWYPAYPPYYWYYPPGFAITGGYIGFGPRVFIGFDLFAWAWFDWPVHRVYVDINKTRRFHHYHYRGDVVRHVWQHNPVHRRGVAYRDRRTSEFYGKRPPRMAPVRPETRGYPGKFPGGRPESRQQLPNRERRDVQDTSLPGKGPGQVQRRDSTIAPQAQPPQREQVQKPARRDTPFQGVGEGSFERRAIKRGESSIRGVTPAPQGGSRGGWSGQRAPSGGGRGGGEMRLPGGGGGGRGSGKKEFR
ncbi:DUF3300 domain-containing protein [Geobacter sulfurreducens]|uniref:DUF3300 domain-containing protein n=1 Tax=Geobacter sulfurreducens TaxID=35554 RepID=UPI002C58D383|nr:DUF3300 domain-containing protein [Geobacter sulfurreducens]HML79655.1 DUF3300 domain-containing protein [Geobacter sulfurreducens]